jgi:hypothetical protein
MTNEQILEQAQSGQPMDISSLGIDADAMMQQLETILLWGVVASVVVAIPLFLLYILSLQRKRKMQKAILDIQKTLHEMNERDKARMGSMQHPNDIQHTDSNPPITAR